MKTKRISERAFYKSVYKRLRNNYARDAFFTPEVQRTIHDAFRAREKPNLVATFINELYG